MTKITPEMIVNHFLHIPTREDSGSAFTEEFRAALISSILTAQNSAIGSDRKCSLSKVSGDICEYLRMRNVDAPHFITAIKWVQRYKAKKNPDLSVLDSVFAPAYRAPAHFLESQQELAPDITVDVRLATPTHAMIPCHVDYVDYVGMYNDINPDAAFAANPERVVELLLELLNLSNNRH